MIVDFNFDGQSHHFTHRQFMAKGTRVLSSTKYDKTVPLRVSVSGSPTSAG